ILTVTPAAVLNSVISSVNPSPTGSNVTFTATLSAAPSGGGIPTGTLQFMTGGSPMASPMALTGGIASLSISSLLHGTNIVAAEYAGDGNFLGSTNDVIQIINTRPVASPAAYTRWINASLQISITNLLSN